jgi:hypothetical protein
MCVGRERGEREREERERMTKQTDRQTLQKVGEMMKIVHASESVPVNCTLFEIK